MKKTFLFNFLLIFVVVFNISAQNNNKNPKPKNVILFIADGTGLAQLYAAYTVNGGVFKPFEAPYTGIVKTTSANKYITDSAAAGTAMSTGTKTNNGAVGVDTEGKNLKTILEIAEANGLATGLVATSKITHATPASFIAHEANRSSYQEIAKHFLNTDIDVFIGGGSEDFDNTRKDGLNLLDSLKKRKYNVALSIDEMEKINSGKLATFTAQGHNPKMSEGRGNMLERASAKAIQLLKTNKKGYFLMIEASMPDWGGHDNDADYIVKEVIDAHHAFSKVLSLVEADKNTLVIFVADHETGGLALIGGSIEDKTIVPAFTTKDHSSIPVPLFAFGPGAEAFTGFYENTEIFHKIVAALKLKK